MSNKINYKIEFKQDVGNSTSTVVIANNIPSLENAVEFALNLHRASNYPHYIYVIHDDMIDITFIKYE